MSRKRDEARLARWRARGEAVTAHVTVKKKEQEGEAVVYCATLDDGARLERAARIGLICWGLAVLSLPILVFHFILVPLFLILGPVMFFLRYGEERVILGSLVTCPVCEHRNRIGEQSESWPITYHCDDCRETLLIAVPAGESAEAAAS
jgi:hypothetical protein